ncbi:GTP cyclohydrolase II [Flavobacterium procerum]|uniref:GTP cyclohydrolase-2 n=1 Tax=Flavobacterium procerum TaxID=1455569 RepID=A0ABV6BPC8_9FLAO
MSLKNQVETQLPTDWGIFKIIAYSEDADDWMPHIVLVHEKTDFEKPVAVRLHSECLTGDIFHSLKCECGKQLHRAMDYFSKNGGILIYLRQEGRNIGIIDKLKAYKLQEKGMDTVQANLSLGLPSDGRSFDEAITILEDLDVKSILLLTNNPEKIKAFENSKVTLIDFISIEIEPTKENEGYLRTKRDFFKHFLNLASI